MEYPKIGEIIKFGNYDWRVLDVQDGRALLLSDRIIEKRKYHHSLIKTTWSECELRGYLNDEFYNTFCEQDRARIVQTKITTGNNPWYGTKDGSTTDDRIFLLSLEEMIKYFGDSGQLKRRAESAYRIDDEFNTARIAYNLDGEADWWWLLSPGYYSTRAAAVRAGGYIGVAGQDVCDEYNSEGGVRPALWLKLEPRIFHSGGLHHAG
jgi:hypothetical protein